MKKFRDPLYGFVILDELEHSILETPPFQRLRYIRQLGTTYLVYPSAHHTRFEHSLGVLQASTETYNSIFADQKNVDVVGWDKKKIDLNRKLLRLASLLHDLGHPPFSHAGEGLFPNGQKHEDYTKRIIQETVIGEKIDKELGGSMSKRVAGIAIEKPLTRDDILLSQILTGEIGTDRVDYLARDSYHLGVPYGYFDYHGLLHVLSIDARKESPEQEEGEPSIIIREAGLHAIESFILARYFMFLQVYFNKTRRILDYHLIEFIKEILPKNQYPQKLDEYIRINDNTVLNKLNGSESKTAKRLVERKHFREVHKTDDHPSIKQEHEFDYLLQALKDRFGEEKIIGDIAEKDPTQYREPEIFFKEGNEYKSIIDKSPLIRNLKTIKQKRIYADPDSREEVKEYCDTLKRKERV